MALNQDFAKGRWFKPNVKQQKCLKRETCRVNLCNLIISKAMAPSRVSHTLSETSQISKISHF